MGRRARDYGCLPRPARAVSHLGRRGQQLDNAAKSLFVLLLLVAAFIAALVWAKNTAGEGT